MFDDIKLRLLHDKMNALMQQELELMKAGKMEEADKVSKQLNETSQKIQELTEKKLEKSGRKADMASARLEERMRAFDEFLGFDEEQSKEEFESRVRK